MGSTNNFTRGERLDRKINLMTPSSTKNASGSVDFDWTVLASVYARVRYVVRTQKELIEGARETSFQEVHFDIRYRSDVSKVTMIDYKSARYDIITIMERGRKQHTTLVTTLRDSEVSA